MKKKILLDITSRTRSYLKAVNRRNIIHDDVAVIGIGVILAFLMNILPILFFFIAFMFIIANIVQIAIAILFIGIGIVLIRWALRGSSKYIKKLGGKKDSHEAFYDRYGDY